MNLFKKGAIGLILWGIFCLGYAHTINPVQISQQRAAVKKILTNLIYSYNIPGAVITYGFKGQPLQTVAVGFRDMSDFLPIENNTLFITGSITKSFTAMAILDLVRSGKIQENETLGKIADQYKGELKGVVSRYPSLTVVTIRELLVHTSGVPEDVNSSIFKNKFIVNPKHVWLDDELLDIAMKRPFYFKPGAAGKWSYTNTDYLLLGVVIRTIVGQEMPTVFRQLWHKAGLQNIYYANNGLIPAEALKNMATGYISVAGSNEMQLAFKNKTKVVVPGAKHYIAYSLNNAYNVFGPTASGMIANTAALAMWYRAIFEGKLLDKMGVDMLLNGISNGKYNHAKYALGVTTHVIPTYGYVVSHDGLAPGFSLFLIYFFKYNLVVALATNSSNPYVSTFDVHNGQILPGFIGAIMPVLVGHLKRSNK